LITAVTSACCVVYPLSRLPGVLWLTLVTTKGRERGREGKIKMAGIYLETAVNNIIFKSL